MFPYLHFVLPAYITIRRIDSMYLRFVLRVELFCSSVRMITFKRMSSGTSLFSTRSPNHSSNHFRTAGAFFYTSSADSKKSIDQWRERQRKRSLSMIELQSAVQRLASRSVQSHQNALIDHWKVTSDVFFHADKTSNDSRKSFWCDFHRWTRHITINTSIAWT